MGELSGASVLLLEDEFLIALDAEQILAELGARAVLTVSNISEARAQIARGGFELAVLDVNVNGEMSFEIADLLRENGIPYIFASGYELRSRPVPPAAVCVSKPYTFERLRE